MTKPLINKGYNGWSQLGVFLGMWGVGLIAGSFAALGAWVALTGKGIESMPTDMLNPAFANAIKSVQAISTVFMFLMPAVAYAFICYQNGWQALGFSRRVNWRTLAICALILLASSPLIDALSELNRAIPLSKAMRAWADRQEKAYDEQVAAIASLKTVGEYIMSLVMVALLPAVFEELLFRGGLQNMFSRWWKKPWTAIIVTSIIFSAIHASWYGFIPRIALGMILGAIFYYTHNIWYSIIVHLANNAAVVTYMYYRTQKNLPVSTSSESVFPWWAGIIAALLLFVLFQWLQKQKQTEVPQEVFYDRTNPFDERGLMG